MARLTIKLAFKPTALKQKQNQLLSNSTNKQAKKTYTAFDFYCVFGLFLRYR